MDDVQQHADFLKSCENNRSIATKYAQFRPILPPEDPKARFPGFRQGLTVLKAGRQVHKGAKPLPIDIVMHESMSMVLSDETKLYYDIFFPSGYESLEAEAVDEGKKIPALVAW